MKGFEFPEGAPLPENILAKMNPEDRPAGKAGKTQEELAVARDVKNEKELQNQIVQYLRMRGVKFLIWQSMARKSGLPPGSPDLIFCYNGYPFAWECKYGSGKRTPEQSDAEKQMQADGWIVQLVKSIGDAKRILDGCQKEFEGKCLTGWRLQTTT